MTVKELIEWLNDCPPEAEVVIEWQGALESASATFYPRDDMADGKPRVMVHAVKG